LTDTSALIGPPRFGRDSTNGKRIGADREAELEQTTGNGIS
jgi:hypothetical protein